jgi:uncharacterized membrane protein YbhN (UPF0104 family)
MKDEEKQTQLNLLTGYAVSYSEVFISNFLCMHVNRTFVSSCYFESVAFTYAGSALTGFGAALLWTGQANYIVLNSEVGHVYRGISTFWILYQSR